jgi:hypothetical protein
MPAASNRHCHIELAVRLVANQSYVSGGDPVDVNQRVTDGNLNSG